MNKKVLYAYYLIKNETIKATLFFAKNKVALTITINNAKIFRFISFNIKIDRKEPLL